ncbi:phosphodiester glycosidase family protein [Microvirga lenta]|uniref:phosphodiester glycosidase family protein n=1 Tax=Microvirga lenta TaxID=2881337 RepID=UPI001CFFA00E|nr:phosphodiester glycosidase family protein [Microvirga lenta]MCB5177760.1 phosphodiester glycosidase family protein [Microvirga lenta]
MLNLARTLAMLVAVVLSTAGPGQAAPMGEVCRTVRSAGNEFAVCTVDLRRHQVRLFWRDPDGQAYGSFSRLLSGPKGSELLFAMNGGMYDEQLAPVGLYVENGREFKRANTAGGPGNFHMKPNGIFFVKGNRAGVLETSRYLRQKIKPDFATQSGPMLVINGRIHPKFSENGTSRKIRNGVGVCGQHTVVFAISNQPVTFHEFASFFRDELDCPNALFLDGSISSLYSPELNRKDGLLPMGPIIGALPRG